jgi:hypothetical protein
MSWSWYVYTARAPSEVIEVGGELDAALASFFDDHDVDEDYAEPAAGGFPPPTPDDVVAHRAQFREVVSPTLLERLGTCRATFSFDCVRSEPDESPLQVSILKFCLERLAPCVIDWGDLSLELGETALGRLSRMRSRGRLGPAPARKARPIKRRVEKPGEVRAVRILEKLDHAAEQVEEHPEAALDLRSAVATLSENAQAYLALLLEEGALPDAAAQKRLGFDGDAFVAMIAEVDKVLLA